MVEKAKLGRPKGSCQYNDTRHLTAIAETLLDSPSMSKTAAFKKVAQAEFAEPKRGAAQKRFERRWKVEGFQFMEIARRERFIRNAEILLNGLADAAIKFAEKAAPVMEAVADSLVDKISRIDPEVIRSVVEFSKQLQDAESTARNVSGQVFRIESSSSR